MIINKSKPKGLAPFFYVFIQTFCLIMVEIKSPVTVIEESTPNQPVTNNSKHTTASSTRSAPHTKRRKVSIACHECRIHKTKCDGAQPMCSSCARKKLPENACIYNPDRGRRGIKNQYVPD